MKKDLKTYRSRIYANYASIFKNQSGVFNEEEALKWGRGYKHYLKNWLPENKNASILDVACGDGKFLFFLKNQNYTNITGVDISPEQVRLARQVSPAVEEADILDYLSAYRGTFDLITGLDIIEHFDKTEVLSFLDACRDALKPGGRLILQTPNAETPWGGSLRYGDFTHEIEFTPCLLQNLLGMTGFRQIEPRETGPAGWGYSFFSSVRYFIWQFIRIGLKTWNLAETGRPGSGIFTRVFLISGVKQ